MDLSASSLPPRVERHLRSVHEPGHHPIVRRPGRIGTFSSVAGRAKFLAAYETAMARWPVPVDAMDVDTTYGRTRVYRSGPADGDPILLLPGAGGTAAMWYPNVRALGDHHPIYAVDTMGDVGLSEQVKVLLDPADTAAWLDELISGLGFTRVHLVGVSYGAWISLNQAIRSPARIATISLLELPKALVPMRKTFIPNVILSAILGTIFPGDRARRTLARWFANPALTEPELMALTLSGRYFRAHIPDARQASEDDLRSIKVPTMLMFGGRSSFHDAGRAAARARLIPRAIIEMVPHATHGITLDATDIVDQRVVAFIDQHQRRSRKPA